VSRLKREGNPPSGQLASPVPQAWDPSINDFREITGQNLGGGRFGADGVQWGKTASGLFMPVRVTNDGVQEVQLSGTIVGVTPGYSIKTIANAVSVPAGTTQTYDLGLTGNERYVFVLINTSEQPWTLEGYNEVGGYATANLYPVYDNATDRYTNTTVPARAILCPIRFRITPGDDVQSIITLAERSYKGLVANGNDRIRFTNGSDKTNTVTIRVQTY
jgi:hypothetical protein